MSDTPNQSQTAVTDPTKAIDPMRIYVLWHSSCEHGQEFAKDIYKWFRGDPGDLSQCGYGIPVEYRSYPYQSGNSPKILAIEPDKATISVIVPLVDQHMVIAPKWREYLKDLAKNTKSWKNTSGLICPVALHSSAYQLPDEITRLNFLRIDRATDSPHWRERERFDIQRQRLLSLLTQVCCRLLWRQNDKPGGAINLDVASSPIKVFISHAKADGTGIAEAIREQIYRQGQLQAFFDESDLAIAYAWEENLKNSAQLSTTAMIAIFTDAYANRPWCRKEIRLARQVRPSQSKYILRLQTLDSLDKLSEPLPESLKDKLSAKNKGLVMMAKIDNASHTRIFDAYYTRIFDQAGGMILNEKSNTFLSEAFIQELDAILSKQELNTQADSALIEDSALTEKIISAWNSTHSSKDADDSSKPANDLEKAHAWHIKPLIVVDALKHSSSYFLPEFGYAPVVKWNREEVSTLIDQLLREILLYGYNEKRALLLQPQQPGQYNLNCTPDLQTFLELWQFTGRNANRVAIPPPGLPRSEENRLTQFLDPNKPTTIVTFDEVREFDTVGAAEAESEDLFEKLLIAVSISKNSDIICSGHGENHLHELTIKVARLVLRAGGSLAYGGDLRPEGFTQTLFLLGQGEQMGNKDWKNRLYSYLAWPYYKTLTPDQEAELINTCQFARIRPTRIGLEDDSDKKFDFDDPDTAGPAIECLSRMRKLMTTGGAELVNGDETPAISARILICGKTQDFMGIMPGIFEEFLWSARQKIPTYILGGFKGAAACLTDVLLSSDQTLTLSAKDYKSKQVTLLAEQHQKKPAELYKYLPDVPNATPLYEDLNRHLTDIRKSDFKDLKNGLDYKENKTLMTTTSDQVILALLRKGLRNIIPKN